MCPWEAISSVALCCSLPGKSSYHRLDVVVRGISTGRTNIPGLPFCNTFMVNEVPSGARGGIAITIQGVAVTGHLIGGYTVRLHP